MPRFTFTRSAIVSETYVIMAETEEAARDELRRGPAPNWSDFVDWYSDDYTLEEDEEEAP